MIEKEEDFAAKMEGQSKDIGRQTEKLKKKQERCGSSCTYNTCTVTF